MDNNQEKKEEWVEVDIQAMAEYLGKDSFNTRVKDIPEEDLYPVELSHTGSGMEVGKELHPKWASLLFNLIDTWKEFIYQFKRKDNE